MLIYKAHDTFLSIAMKLSLFSFDLKLKHTFKIAHGTRDVQKTLIVALSEGAYTGLGEAAANTYFGIKMEEMVSQLEELEERISKHSLKSPADFWVEMNPFFKGQTFPQCALDMAAYDLYARISGKPLYKVLNLSKPKAPVSNYTIGIDTVEKMLEKMKEKPWPIYKIKLGTADDLEIVKALRTHTDAVFRVDANGAWDVAQCIENARAFKSLNVEFIEQPLRADDMAGMKEVMKYSVLPLMADESCLLEEDVENCHKHFHGINIKLSKCGGITPALRMIEKARNLGMKVMLGCMTESSVGISAIAHLLPLLDYVDMDGAMLLSQDIASGVEVTDEGVLLAEGNGSGARLLH